MSQFHRLASLYLTIAVLTVFLTGCGSDRVVSVPTPVACVKPADVPDEPAPVASQLTGDARRDIAVVAVLALELRDYAGKLRALLKGCGA